MMFVPGSLKLKMLVSGAGSRSGDLSITFIRRTSANISGLRETETEQQRKRDRDRATEKERQEDRAGEV